MWAICVAFVGCTYVFKCCRFVFGDTYWNANLVAKFIVPDWGDKFDSEIWLSNRPASLCSLSGRYYNPMPESTSVYPPFRDYEFGYMIVASDAAILVTKAAKSCVMWIIRKLKIGHFSTVRLFKEIDRIFSKSKYEIPLPVLIQDGRVYFDLSP